MGNMLPQPNTLLLLVLMHTEQVDETLAQNSLRALAHLRACGLKCIYLLGMHEHQQQ